MELLPKFFDDLVAGLKFLPGVGPRSAQRMALYLLELGHRDKARVLANSIVDAIDALGHCQRCRNYTDQPVCALCTSSSREDSTLCIVETPADLIAIESSGSYKGRYFVLMGKLSPIDGVGPADLGFDQLYRQVRNDPPEEIILALSATVEGEATCHSLSEKLADLDTTISRISQGIPTGGNIEYLDTRTLIHAIDDRRPAIRD